jgi:hypothetical protein
VSEHPAPTLLTPVLSEQFRRGDYVHSDTDLYRIEEVVGDRVVLEDCRTELLIETDRRRLARLKRVERSQSEAPDGETEAQGGEASRTPPEP